MDIKTKRTWFDSAEIIKVREYTKKGDVQPSGFYVDIAMVGAPVMQLLSQTAPPVKTGETVGVVLHGVYDTFQKEWQNKDGSTGRRTVSAPIPDRIEGWFKLS